MIAPGGLVLVVEVDIDGRAPIGEVEALRNVEEVGLAILLDCDARVCCPELEVTVVYIVSCEEDFPGTVVEVVTATSCGAERMADMVATEDVDLLPSDEDFPGRFEGLGTGEICWPDWVDDRVDILPATEALPGVAAGIGTTVTVFCTEWVVEIAAVEPPC